MPTGALAPLTFPDSRVRADSSSLGDAATRLLGAPLLVACLAASCAGGDAPASEARPSASGAYRVRLTCEGSSIPLDRIHSWVVEIRDSSGRPVEDAILVVDGGMPEHEHGLPTRPEVRERLGKGRYRVDGMKFSMTGRWELVVRFWVDERPDEVRFDVEVRP